MTKRSSTKGGNSRSRTKAAPKKAPANKGKGNSKASIASSAKSDNGNSSSVTASEHEDNDAEEILNKVSPGGKDSPDLDDIPMYSRNDVTLILSRILGEEHYGFEHKYNDEDTSHIPPNAEQRRRNGRLAGRDLIIWNRPYMDAKLLLIIQYECARFSIELPWDAIAHRLHPGSSGSAILQHLGRLRNTVFTNGHMVPPDLPKGSSNSQDPSIHMLRGFYRMPLNVRWSPSEPLFAAKRAITFSDKFEHSALNLGDMHCLPFDADTALEDGIIVDGDNKIIRQNNRKVPKSKVKVGAVQRKKPTAKDTSSAAAFATVSTKPANTVASKPAAKKKTTKRAAPTSDSEDNYDPSAKPASSRARPSRAAKRVKTYHEADPEEEEDDPSDVLEIQEADPADVPPEGDQAEQGVSSPAQDEAPTAVASPHIQASHTQDALGLFSGSVTEDAEEAQVPSDDENASSSDGDDGDDGHAPTSFGEMLANDAGFDSNSSSFGLAQTQQSEQMPLDHMMNPFFGHFASQIPSDGMTIYPRSLHQFSSVHNIDGTKSASRSPQELSAQAPASTSNVDMNSFHRNGMTDAANHDSTLMQSFGASQAAPMATMSGSYTPPGAAFGGAEGFFGRALSHAVQSNSVQFSGQELHNGFPYLNNERPDRQGQ